MHKAARFLIILMIPALAAAQAPDTGWPVNGGSDRGEHYSPLDDIDVDTVAELGLDWSLDLPTPDGIAATPIVVDGVIYLSGPWSLAWAVDAASGELLWSYDPETVITDSNNWTGRVNRGVAVVGDRVLVTVSDCRLVGLDRASGQPAWTQQTCDPAQGYSISDAPHVGGGKVFVGNAGSEKGVRNRGYISAYDANTGEFLWRFYVVPSHVPEENMTPAMKMAYASWSGDALEKYGGGGSNWNEMTYDPGSGLLYFGTAGALPYVYEKRSPGGGDNLFTSSVVAVNAETGEYAWHYQTVPEDSWEYNATMNIVLAELEIGGQSRKTLMIAPKNGFFYVLDRLDGQLLSAAPFARVNWATHVDLETGRPVLSPEGMYWKAPPGTSTLVWPNMWGAHGTQPMAFHPGLGLVYIPVVDVPNLVTWHGDGEFSDKLVMLDEIDGKPHVPGLLRAWDPVRQVARWTVQHDVAFNGGVLATAGGLVFQGDANGRFSAFRAADGTRVWSVDTGSAISAAPVSYHLSGRQRVLVPVGAGSGMQFAYPRFHAGRKATGPTRLMSFSLEGKTEMPAAPVLRRELPEPQPLTANADTVAHGASLYRDWGCYACHGDDAVARAGGSVPDLRYASPATHLQWNGIVIGGARQARGMPAHRMGADEAEAIRAFVLSRAHALRADTQGSSR